MRKAIALLVLIACGGAPASVATLPNAPPGPPSSVDASTVHTSMLPDSRVLVRGTLVDLGNRRVVRELTSDHVLLGALRGDDAYLCVGTNVPPPVDTMKHELRAYDLVSGRVRWVVPVEDCRALGATSEGVVNGGFGTLSFHSRSDGIADVRSERDEDDVRAIEPLGESIFVFHSSGDVDRLDARGKETGHTKLSFIPRFFHDEFVQRRGDLLCPVDVDGVGIDATCIDEEMHPKFVVEEKVGPNAWGRDLGGAYALGAKASPPQSVVLDLDRGKLALRLPIDAAALVRGEHDTLDGLFVTHPPAAFVNLDGTTKFTTQISFEDAASVLHGSGKLFVLSYHPNATGAAFVALDDKTGALEWRASLTLLPIAHSRYVNHSTLDWDAGAIRVHVHESGQEYFGIFSTEGKALFEVAR